MSFQKSKKCIESKCSFYEKSDTCSINDFLKRGCETDADFELNMEAGLYSRFKDFATQGMKRSATPQRNQIVSVLTGFPKSEDELIEKNVVVNPAGNQGQAEPVVVSSSSQSSAPVMNQVSIDPETGQVSAGAPAVQSVSSQPTEGTVTGSIKKAVKGILGTASGAEIKTSDVKTGKKEVGSASEADIQFSDVDEPKKGKATIIKE